MGSGTAPVSATGWHVTSQQEVTDLGPGGQFTRGYRITFALATGTPGSVFIPRTAYTEDNVRSAIVAWATRVAKIGNLSG